MADLIVVTSSPAVSPATTVIHANRNTLVVPLADRNATSTITVAGSATSTPTATGVATSTLTVSDG